MFKKDCPMFKKDCPMKDCPMFLYIIFIDLML